MNSIPEWMLVGLLAVALITDIRWRKIPNVLTVVASLAGLIYYVITDGWDGLRFAGGGWGILLVIMIGLYLLKAVGAGDVKLFAAIGAICGAMMALECLIYSIFYAGIIALIVISLQKGWTSLLTNGKRLWIRLFMMHNYDVWTETAAKSRRFPFMLAVVPGVATVFFYS